MKPGAGRVRRRSISAPAWPTALAFFLVLAWISDPERESYTATERMVVVPDVWGLNAYRAVRTLRAAGFTRIRCEHTYVHFAVPLSDITPDTDYHVSIISPPPGIEWAAGRPVSLSVATSADDVAWNMS